jgi:hypothetical protein
MQVTTTFTTEIEEFKISEQMFVKGLIIKKCWLLEQKYLLYFPFEFSQFLSVYFSRQSNCFLSPVEPLMKRVMTLVITVRIFTFSLWWICVTDVHSTLHGTRKFVTLCRRMCHRALFLGTKIQCKTSRSIF